MTETSRRGADKIAWASAHMPLLAALREELLKERPFSGRRIAMSIHLEAKTACLAMLLRDGGAEVAVTGSNPLSTQDDVATALAEEEGVVVHARRGVDEEEYTEHLRAVLATRPHAILDDGGDLVALLDPPYDELVGGCEETTTGVARLHALHREGRLRFPMFAVNDARMKHLFDNRYGTGQSVWDAIMRSTNRLVAGSRVVVVGYGWCGRGIALRAAGLGARVTVCEVDPVRAVEARMDGFDVAPVADAVREADFLVTATGCVDAVDEKALAHARDGLLLANAGHFDVEVPVETLSRLATSERKPREGIVEYLLDDGRRLYVLGEGRLVNLVLGDGHPIEIMDISFAVQTLTLRHLLESPPLPPGVYDVPATIDRDVASRKLRSLGICIDSLSPAQQAYLDHA
ncbi:MAG: adenosylhomocysteinase [Candidatus Bipolaricaulota bacterium]|nr:MAG: adenosylhomocysteinase [Candidatus Bipolaricaulota bacterium]